MLVISRVEAFRVRLPLKADHRMISALGRHDESHFVIVRLVTEAGLDGAGEASITVRWSGETPFGAVAVVERILSSALAGLHLDPAAPYDSIVTLDRKMDTIVKHNWFIKSAIEMAAWDVMGKACGQPVYELLGGACRPLAIRSRFSMGAYDLPRARARAQQLVAEGFDTVKVKVGGKPEDDIPRVRTVREVIGPERKLVIDANCGWSADTAIHCVKELADARVDVVEQPTPDGDYAAMARVRRETGACVMADDMCFDFIHAQELIRNQGCDLISVYPGKNGGIRKSREIVQLAERHGIGCTIGSNLEWDIATAAMGHLIVATPNLKIERWPGDIHGPEYYETRIVKEPLRIEGPTTHLTNRPGLGVDVDWDLVRKHGGE